MAAVLESGKSSLETNETTALLQYIPPPVELVIAGAGNDAQPLARFAELLGWRITVLDGRKTHATAARFPQAHGIRVGKPPEVLQDIRMGPQTAFVLMSHNYLYDRDMLAQLLNSGAAYIGVLGPRKKTAQLLQELQEQGISISQQALQPVYAPTGLQLGAETAEEIALSVIAEIKAVLSGQQGGHLRDHNGPIHTHSSAISSPAL
jgi:xanthine/CO dehydrogenase XdhC/CoxF family maturation factor